MSGPNNGAITIQEPESTDPERISEVHTRWEKLPGRKEEDVEANESIYNLNDTRSGDFRVKQSIGVIYGDIGTSPLYVYSSTFLTPPSYDDLLGALSLIIWSLTFIVTVKYVAVVLCADDEGEGGSFALYSLITRYTNIMQRNPREPLGVRLERHMTRDMSKPNTDFRRLLETSAIFRNIVKIFAVLGVSMVLADGVLTPAQSILGAIQGLQVAAPHIETKTIVGISCAVLVILFAIQPFGTSKIGSSFAPIVIIWLAINWAYGIYNLVKYDHSVLKAFSPYYAGLYFVRNGTDGWKSLGGILLAFTGVEALFADLGAFSARAIRLSWLAFTYPCLLLAYIGQAAYISVKPEAVSNPFFNSVPPGMYWPSLIISVLAAFVASQAMITGAFQLLSQTMHMSYFPNIKLVHTSTKFHGQVYIPMANYLMFAGTILVTVVYNNTTRLGHAYGVCVVMVTFITTSLVAVVAMVVWRLHILIVLAGFLIFGCLDMLFLSSALLKFPDGAWFTIMVGGVLSCILLLWRFGKNEQWASEATDRSPSNLVNIGKAGELRLKVPDGDKELTILKGLGIFFDKAGCLSPTVYVHFLHKFEAHHEVTIFFNLRHLSYPHVDEQDRYSISRIGVSNTFRIVARQGYMDNVFTEDFGTVLLEQLRTFLEGEIGRVPEAGAPALVARAKKELEALETAYKKQVIYIFGKEQLHPKKEAKWVRRLLLGIFVWMRENTRSKPAEFGVQVDRLVEVGFVKEV
ncbi:putative potassium transporter 5 [Wilcoxina mikolae CBS 423.85]|nr:putative potassium transporter 5 [Wilcoxina mikolae CBS 423.85]